MDPAPLNEDFMSRLDLLTLDPVMLRTRQADEIASPAAQAVVQWVNIST